MKEKKTRFIGIDLGKRTYAMAVTGKGIGVPPVQRTVN